MCEESVAAKRDSFYFYRESVNPMARPPALLWFIFATVLFSPSASQSVNYGLELASADVSWRICRTGFNDPMFPDVCPASSARNPLHVAVTVSVTWWAAPSLSGQGGPGQWSTGQRQVLLQVEKGGMLERRIGWKMVGSDDAMTVLAPASGSAYRFAVTHNEAMSTKTNASIAFVTTALSFMVNLTREGEYEVAFTGCCRWADLANFEQKNYPHSVPWYVSARIVASIDSALAPSFSPRLSMPITPVVLWDNARLAFRIYADSGHELVSLLDETDISGRYLQTPLRMSLDSTVFVTTDTRYAAYVREDFQKSILWFEAPESGKNLFAASGAIPCPFAAEHTHTHTHTHTHCPFLPHSLLPCKLPCKLHCWICVVLSSFTSFPLLCQY